MKKLFSIILSISMILSVLTVPYVANAEEYGLVDFAGGTAPDLVWVDPNNNRTDATYDRGSGNYAYRIDFAANYPFYYVPNGSACVSADVVKLSFDFNVLAVPDEYADAIWNIQPLAWKYGIGEAKSMQNPEYSGNLKADGTVAGADNFTWTQNKWYNYAIIFNYVAQTYDIEITDLETNTSTAVIVGVPMYNDTPSSPWLNFAQMRLDSACEFSVVFDNLKADTFSLPTITSPANNSSTDGSSINIVVNVPAGTANAVLSVDGAVQELNLVAGQTEYTVPVTVDALGSHLAVLLGTVGGRDYSHEVRFYTTKRGLNPASALDFKVCSTEYWISQCIGGGIGGTNNRAVESRYNYLDTTNPDLYEWSTIKYNAADASNPIFLNIANGFAGAGNNLYVQTILAPEQTNEEYIFSLYNGGTWAGNINIFSADGTIFGSDKTYSASSAAHGAGIIPDWINVEVYISNGTTYEVWVDHEYIRTGTLESPQPSFTSLRAWMNGNNGAAAYAFDRIRVGGTATLANVTEIASVKNGQTKDVVVADADAIKLSFDRAMDLSTLTSDTISIISNDKPITVTDVTDDGNNSYLVSFEGELEMCSQLKITLSSDVKDGNNTAFGVPYVVYGETDTKSETFITDIAINRTGNTVSAAVEVYWAPANGSNCVFILAGYNDDELVDIAYKPTTFLTHGKNIITVSEENVNGTTFKAFLWSSIHGSIKPLK